MAKDLYRYFRIEAQELVESLHRGLLELEKAPEGQEELLPRLLRYAHTLKGASRVVRRPDIGDLSHQLEDVLSPYRDAGTPVEKKSIDASFERLDAIRQLMENLEAPASSNARPSAERPPKNPSDGGGIRIAVRELDAILENALEAHTAVSSLAKEISDLRGMGLDLSALGQRLLSSNRQQPHRAEVEWEQWLGQFENHQRKLQETTERALSDLAELRAVATESRLIPASELATELESVVRNAAQTLQKDVQFEVKGADTHIDAHVLSGVRKALIHLVRNGVAHGIEARAIREASGKPPVGRIQVQIERRGHRVSIQCHDDGGGFDLELIRKTAVERGIATAFETEALDETELLAQVLRSGFSTRQTVNDVAGRGVGLDVVRHVVDALNGELVLKSTPGRGATIDIVVPLSLSAIPVLLMRSAETSVLMPLDSIVRVHRVSSEEVFQNEQHSRIAIDEEVLPFLSLRNVLGQPASDSGMQNVVVFQSENKKAALGVDQLGEARRVAIRSLPKHASTPLVYGASLDERGTVELFLTPAALIQLTDNPSKHRVVPLCDERSPLLVIDDSLTTRMLEQSILESAGYEVDLAVSAEDGIAKARQRQYGVFIVDVEMPGMNGFEFVETTRRDPDLRRVPAILVTSRNDPEDKQRGREAGASAYIVKSEFDQAELIATIRRLTE